MQGNRVKRRATHEHGASLPPPKPANARHKRRRPLHPLSEAPGSSLQSFGRMQVCAIPSVSGVRVFNGKLERCLGKMRTPSTLGLYALNFFRRPRTSQAGPSSGPAPSAPQPSCAACRRSPGRSHRSHPFSWIASLFSAIHFRQSA